MSYQEYIPHPLLTDYIKCLWVIERDFQPLQGNLDVLPDSYIELIFNTGSTCQIDNEQSLEELPSCYLVSLFSKPFQLRADGVVKTIGVRFFAWGFSSLMGINLDSTKTIHLLDTEWQNLSSHINLLNTEDALDHLQHYFMQLALHVKSHEREVQNTSQMLFDQKTGIKIDDLANQCHLSRRQLERRFQAEIGMSPKTLALRMRFEQVRDELCHDPDIDLALLAVDYGYADQAHLSREFKSFSNRTISQFIAEIRPIREELRYGVAFF